MGNTSVRVSKETHELLIELKGLLQIERKSIISLDTAINAAAQAAIAELNQKGNS